MKERLFGGGIKEILQRSSNDKEGCWKYIAKLKTQSKEKGFKNLLPQDEPKLKWVIAKQTLLTSFKKKCVFIHNNAPSPISKLTFEFFEHKRFIGEKIIKYPPLSPDLNLIENLCPIIKIKVYAGDR